MIAYISAFGGAKPPFTSKLLVHGLQNLWFMGCKTFGSWVAKPFVHGLQKSFVKKERRENFQNLFSPSLKKKKT
jgi:hypothetical protein